MCVAPYAMILSIGYARGYGHAFLGGCYALFACLLVAPHRVLHVFPLSAPCGDPCSFFRGSLNGFGYVEIFSPLFSSNFSWKRDPVNAIHAALFRDDLYLDLLDLLDLLALLVPLVPLVLRVLLVLLDLVVLCHDDLSTTFVHFDHVNDGAAKN